MRLGLAVFRRGTCAALLLILLQPVWAQNAAELPRRAFLGVRVGPLTELQSQQVDYGLNIVSVFPNSTASAYALEPGQIILQANQQRLEASADLPDALAGLRSGDEVEFLLLREGREQQLSMSLRAFPAEAYANVRVSYDAINTVNGTQRSILTVPEGVEAAPVVYVLQGFDCSSVDMALQPQNSTSLLIEKLSSAGFATYRVEKSGRGDSTGRACSEIGFDAETAGFVAGLEQLAGYTEIDPSQIYLLGISLGGVWAPALAEQRAVAGIISFGTIAKTWQEYMSDNWRRQWALAGKPSAAVDEDLKRANIFWYQLVEERLAPDAIFDRFRQTAPLAPALAYQPEGELMFGRHYSFTRELAQTNLMASWDAVNAPTLLLWGRGDYVASEQDQRLIYDSLRKREVDVELQYLDVDHYWREARDFETSYRGLREGDRAEISEEVYSAIIEWLGTVG